MSLFGALSRDAHLNPAMQVIGRPQLDDTGRPQPISDPRMKAPSSGTSRCSCLNHVQVSRTKTKDTPYWPLEPLVYDVIRTEIQVCK